MTIIAIGSGIYIDWTLPAGNGDIDLVVVELKIIGTSEGSGVVGSTFFFWPFRFAVVVEVKGGLA